MLIQMRTQSLDLAAAIQRHLDRRVRASLRASAARVRSVTVSLSDVNGPRGGIDLHCALTFDLIPRGSVRATATDSDLLVAFGRALTRVQRSLDRDRGARRERRVRPGRAPRIRAARGAALPEAMTI